MRYRMGRSRCGKRKVVVKGPACFHWWKGPSFDTLEKLAKREARWELSRMIEPRGVESDTAAGLLVICWWDTLLLLSCHGRFEITGRKKRGFAVNAIFILFGVFRSSLGLCFQVVWEGLPRLNYAPEYLYLIFVLYGYPFRGLLLSDSSGWRGLKKFGVVWR